jgi:glycopeptide antibiotics resistance protein
MRLNDRPNSTLSAALLIYIIFVVLLITLIPFDFRFPDRIQIVWTTNFSDTIINVFLFIPVGFLFKLYRRGKIDSYFLITFGAGMLLSFSIECAQLFLPGRYTHPMDIVTNGSGAWLGALLFKLLSLSRHFPFCRQVSFKKEW